jgi:hypothetical protein
VTGITKDAKEALLRRLRVAGGPLTRLGGAPRSNTEITMWANEFFPWLNSIPVLPEPQPGELPRCRHGAALRDWSGEALEPSCGCRAEKPDVDGCCRSCGHRLTGSEAGITVNRAPGEAEAAAGDAVTRKGTDGGNPPTRPSSGRPAAGDSHGIQESQGAGASPESTQGKGVEVASRCEATDGKVRGARTYVSEAEAAFNHLSRHWYDDQSNNVMHPTDLKAEAKREAFRKALPEPHEGGCKCGVCRLGSEIERLKGMVDATGAATLEHVACSLADAETERDMAEAHLDELRAALRAAAAAPDAETVRRAHLMLDWLDSIFGVDDTGEVLPRDYDEAISAVRAALYPLPEKEGGS